MKQLCFALSLVLLLSSCQKDLTSKDEVITAVVASDANSPLKSHTLTFTSDYPVKPGEVPPFSFTKTQYSDARIKTIRMLSRKNPIHPEFKKEAVELIGTFTYAPNTIGYYPDAPHLAYLNGTSEVWEYYKTPAGVGTRKSISKKNVNFRFFITPEGYCMAIEDLTSGTAETVLQVGYNPDRPHVIDIINVPASTLYYPNYDQYGNVTGFHFPYGEPQSYLHISYDYSSPRGNKNFSFIPSQNLISQEFSLLEVMQWVPQPTHARKSAGGIFKVNGVKVYQDQVYKNYMFDVNGNQKSLTYGDNILQKTSWHVQP